MELKTCKEKTQKGEITWSLHLYLWPYPTGSLQKVAIFLNM